MLSGRTNRGASLRTARPVYAAQMAESQEPSPLFRPCLSSGTGIGVPDSEHHIQARRIPEVRKGSHQVMGWVVGRNYVTLHPMSPTNLMKFPSWEVMKCTTTFWPRGID